MRSFCLRRRKLLPARCHRDMLSPGDFGSHCHDCEVWTSYVCQFVKIIERRDTGVFLLRGPRFVMEPVYNRLIFNSFRSKFNSTVFSLLELHVTHTLHLATPRCWSLCIFYYQLSVTGTPSYSSAASHRLPSPPSSSEHGVCSSLHQHAASLLASALNRRCPCLPPISSSTCSHH